MSLRDKILAADDMEAQIIDVPEWDVKIEMRTPTVEKRGRMIADYMNDAGQLDHVRMYPVLLIATAYDPETGEPVFTMDDVEALQGKSAKAMERACEVALEVSGMKDVQARVDAGKDGSTSTPTGPGSSS